MKLILFRHGIAEERGLRENDELRELTLKGINKTKIAGKALKKLISEDKDVCIWSSPLTRALQTSKILQTSLKVQNISILDSISQNVFSSLEKQILSESSDKTIIIVGHSPYLDDWCLKITGVNLQLKKSGAVCIELTQNENLEGQILWFIQPKIWKLLKKQILKGK